MKLEDYKNHLIDKAVEHFGTTENPNEAGYVLPDGRMLDFSGRHAYRHEKGPDSFFNRRTVTHSNIQHIIPDWDKSHKGQYATHHFMKHTGAMRIDGNHMYEVSNGFPITSKQIDRIHNGSKTDDGARATVDFAFDQHEEGVQRSRWHSKDYSVRHPAVITNDIKKWQSGDKSWNIEDIHHIFASDEKENYKNHLINTAIKNHGITNNIYEAGYILPDGRMLDFSGRHKDSRYVRKGEKYVPKDGESDYLADDRRIEHCYIDAGLSDDDKLRGAIPAFMKHTGAVRIAPSACGVQIHENHPLTQHQEKIIHHMAKNDDNDHGFTIDLTPHSGKDYLDRKTSRTYHSVRHPAKITNDIRKWHNGEDLESNHNIFANDQSRSILSMSNKPMNRDRRIKEMESLDIPKSRGQAIPPQKVVPDKKKKFLDDRNKAKKELRDYRFSSLDISEKLLKLASSIIKEEDASPDEQETFSQKLRDLSNLKGKLISKKNFKLGRYIHQPIQTSTTIEHLVDLLLHAANN